MSPGIVLLPVVVPGVAALACLAGWRRPRVAGAALVSGLVANAAAVAVVYRAPLALAVPLGGLDLALAFRVDALASFVVAAAAVLALLIGLYADRFMDGREHAAAFHASFLLTVALVNGAALADHLVTLLVFWEAMMIPLWIMIAVGRSGAWRTATKAFFISGVTDLCLMAGVGLVQAEAGTLLMSRIHLGTAGLSGLAFALMAIGAASKAGSMPFHSWIPDAALDAPAPFMALVPGVLEKLLGVYLLARVSLDLFTVGGPAGTALMALGAITIVLAVAMALVQKDYKRLLSFHAISQVGYMILGIGTGTTPGIVGGLFHMVNHAMYKGTLFLTGGAVERQAGTTDLARLGGLARRMPVTFGCFVVAALSISGVWPFNGFFSKELVYEGALARGGVFYAAAALGSFLTAASFLKLGHAAFKGPERAPDLARVREAPLEMLLPMVAIAGGCVAFGVANVLPVERLVIPAVAPHLEAGHHLAGLLPAAWGLAAVTVLVQLAAIAHHAWGVRRSGSALGAVDHLHHAPVARQLYAAAERRAFDPYERALVALNAFARLALRVDRAIDVAVDGVQCALASAGSLLVRRAHTGSYAAYLAWSMLALAGIVAFFVGGV